MIIELPQVEASDHQSKASVCQDGLALLQNACEETDKLMSKDQEIE
jgi:hypothetical protein